MIFGAEECVMISGYLWSILILIGAVVDGNDAMVVYNHRHNLGTLSDQGNEKGMERTGTV